MAKESLFDLVVVIPGITGSTLERDGQTIWGLNASAAWNAITTGGDTIRDLALSGDTVDDGVIATGLMQDVHIIPGLWKIDGYSALRNQIANVFEVREADLRNGGVTNYIEFPYDWRRDNRLSGAELGEAIARALFVWRRDVAPNAKVIILAHSMGGLVARHWLEVLDGWRDCRALITFGTPFRGSPNAVSYLANGYRKLLDFSATMRSFTSVYQLLPTYPCVQVADGTWIKVSEGDVHPNIDRARALSAAAFHDDIANAVAVHHTNETYRTAGTGYRILPVVGVSQTTLQSASGPAGAFNVGETLPPHIRLRAGDGTVPRYSATPVELSDDFAETFVADKHASLQANNEILRGIVQKIIQMQSRADFALAIRGPDSASPPADATALDLQLEDAYLPGEAVVIDVGLRRLETGAADDVGLAEAPPNAAIRPVDRAGATLRPAFERFGDGWRLEAKGLVPGLYRVHVQMLGDVRDRLPPQPVSDVFAIAGAAT